MSTKNKYMFFFILGAFTFWGYNKYAFPEVEKKIKPTKAVVGIIGAMEEEIDILKNSIKLDTVMISSGMNFYLGKVNGRRVAVVRSGIGKVNAAIATQLLIDKYDASVIINTGVAGGLNDTLQIGDIVIAKSLQYHDFDVTIFDYKKGVVPRMDTSVFYSNRILMGEFLNEANKLEYRVGYGKVVSGDQFIADELKKSFIKKYFNADVVEMESAAIAHVCYLSKVPFVVLRSISDKAGGESAKNYSEFEKEAARKSANLVLEYLH
ncbi:MAG: 5'-methylthioadenosine/adenosylhomocysteine nucleosidase [Ichthyobacteriaceae bacterium]|nr:5'-methylthioadenosine/adenosylhomocysteine nucleosidase [Ichthyobacteriaceae bacterium]